MKRSIFLAVATVIVLVVPLQAETIDFEAFEHGAYASIVGEVGVFGNHPNDPGRNHAVVFDSSFTTRRLFDELIDEDLGTPSRICGGPGNGTADAVGPGGEFENCTNQRNVLMVNGLDLRDEYINETDAIGQDGLVDRPNDFALSAADNVTLTFSFPMNVDAVSMVAIDFDGNGPDPRVELFDEADNLLGTFPIKNNDPGNGKQLIDFGNTPNVRKMVVWVQGSGAIDNVVYRRRGGTGCTPGFWKNHFGDGPQDNYWPVDSLASGMETIWSEYFGVCEYPELDPKLLTNTIGLKGGGWKKIGRHGTAALLNALHPEVSYPYSVPQVVDIVCTGRMGPLVIANELSDECPAKELDPYD